jgi:Dienelactone hydrolase family
VPFEPGPHCGVFSKATLAVFVLALAVRPSGVRGQVRLRMYPIETVTLSSQQILSGEKNGKQTVLAGELRIPAGAGRLPAMILVHGSDGLNSAVERWAQELNQIGVAAFLLDCFSGRGITNTVGDQSQLHNLNMMVDAYKALEVLTQDPRLDANRIAIMGFSKGAFLAVYTSIERFRTLYGPANGSHFAAHIGLYTPCNVTYRDDDKSLVHRSACFTASLTIGSPSARVAHTPIDYGTLVSTSLSRSIQELNTGMTFSFSEPNR